MAPSIPPAISPPPIQDAQALDSWLPWLRRWLLVFFLLGLGWRLLRYLLQFPIWGDEAYLCLNFLGQTHTGLLSEVKNSIVAPLLFLWGELTMFQCLGSGELALRLLPTVAGLAALPLFWRLARQVLNPLAATLAVGMLAVAYYPVRHACEVKPYSFDLLVSIVLMTLAVAWLQQPRRLGLLVLLCLSLPLALGLSNPVVFVVGGISVALGPTVWRQPAKAKVLWLVFNGVLGLTFLGYFYLNMQMQSEECMQFLRTYWAPAFPPKEPLALLKWLVVTHTSNMMAYPIGGKNFGSTLTFLLFLAGVWQFTRARRWDVVLLLLVPFVLTFVAAWMRRYPYGDSARVCQHLAPAICLLTAAGLASLISWLCRTLRAQKLAVAAACAVLVAVGLAGFARDLVQPFKTVGDQKCRHIVQAIAAQAGPHSPIVLLNDWQQTQPEFVWYLFINHPQTFWRTDANWNALAGGKRLLCLRIFDQNHLPQQLPELPPGSPARTWHLAGRKVHSRPLDHHTGIIEIIEVLDFQCSTVASSVKIEARPSPTPRAATRLAPYPASPPRSKTS